VEAILVEVKKVEQNLTCLNHLTIDFDGDKCTLWNP
jgi:hypothetical protein